jgi:hypothetical protein
VHTQKMMVISAIGRHTTGVHSSPVPRVLQAPSTHFNECFSPKVALYGMVLYSLLGVGAAEHCEYEHTMY